MVGKDQCLAPLIPLHGAKTEVMVTSKTVLTGSTCLGGGAYSAKCSSLNYVKQSSHLELTHKTNRMACFVFASVIPGPHTAGQQKQPAEPYIPNKTESYTRPSWPSNFP